MTLFDNLWNDFVRLKKKIIKYSYVFYPTLGLIFYFSLLKNLIASNESKISNEIAPIAGTLAGFLFTFLGIIIALPSTEFTKILKKIGYMNYIYRTLLIGVISLVISMLFSIFRLSSNITIITFVIGISETFLSIYYVYNISVLTMKSV